MEDLVESECERHGLGLHIVFHEAGHAVAAVDHDLPFRRIVLYDAEGGPTFDNGLRRAAAAVEMHSEDASTWVQPDQDAALRFVLAGCLAEIAALGHAIEGGFTGDIRAWRIGAGRANEVTAAELDSLVGQPFLDVVTLGFYLDNERVHVGDVDSCLGGAFAACSRERAGGRDCLMLAPTREFVRELNLRAQADLGPSGAAVGLADGCQAHRDDVVISRRNDRRLGVSGTDWVKNGDRWIVTEVRSDGALSVRHATSRLHATLPAEYVREHVELGYASTVHTAQGITTDVVHGILTGTEDRQVLYTMLTRGRVENHAHIVLDTDASHALPSPLGERALTATEVLEGILARDGAAVSATSTQTRAASPTALLQDAVARYADAVALATSQLHAEPVDDGPLPWLAGVPDEVAAHPGWGPYLAARSRRVASLAADVAADPVLPEWTSRYDGDVLTPELRRELAVWRAAVGVPEDERTMAGPVPHDDREASYHRRLTKRINARHGEAVQVWADRVVEYVGKRDEQTPELAKYLDQLARKGVDAERLLDLAAARKPLPVDHPASALAYRVKDLATPKKRRTPQSIDPFPRPSPQQSGPSLGL